MHTSPVHVFEDLPMLCITNRIAGLKEYPFSNLARVAKDSGLIVPV